MVERGGACASRETAQAIGIERKGRGQDFQRDVAIELAVARAESWPIPPAPSGARTDRDRSSLDCPSGAYRVRSIR
jgi:hypothetical protein